MKAYLALAVDPPGDPDSDLAAAKILAAHALIVSLLDRLFSREEQAEKIVALGVSLGRLASSLGFPVEKAVGAVTRGFELSEEAKR